MYSSADRMMLFPPYAFSSSPSSHGHVSDTGSDSSGAVSLALAVPWQGEEVEYEQTRSSLLLTRPLLKCEQDITDSSPSSSSGSSVVSRQAKRPRSHPASPLPFSSTLPPPLAPHAHPPTSFTGPQPSMATIARFFSSTASATTAVSRSLPSPPSPPSPPPSFHPSFQPSAALNLLNGAPISAPAASNVFVHLKLQFNCLPSDLFTPCQTAPRFSFCLRKPTPSSDWSAGEPSPWPPVPSNHFILTTLSIFMMQQADDKHYRAKVKSSTPHMSLLRVASNNKKTSHTAAPATTFISPAMGDDAPAVTNTPSPANSHDHSSNNCWRMESGVVSVSLDRIDDRTAASGLLLLHQHTKKDNIVVSSTGVGGCPILHCSAHLSYCLTIEVQQDRLHFLDSSLPFQEQIASCVDIVVHEPNRKQQPRPSRSLGLHGLVHCDVRVLPRPLTSTEMSSWHQIHRKRQQSSDSLLMENPRAGLRFTETTDIWDTLQLVVNEDREAAQNLYLDFRGRIADHEAQPMHESAHNPRGASIVQMLHILSVFNWQEAEVKIRQIHLKTEDELYRRDPQGSNERLADLAAVQRLERFFVVFCMQRRGGDWDLLTRDSHYATLCHVLHFPTTRNYNQPLSSTMIAKAITLHVLNSPAFSALDHYWRCHLYFELALCYLDSGLLEDLDQDTTRQHLKLSQQYFELSRLLSIDCAQRCTLLKSHAAVCSMHEQGVVIQRYLSLPHNIAQLDEIISELQFVTIKLCLLKRQFKEGSFLYLNCAALLIVCQTLSARFRGDAQPLNERVCKAFERYFRGAWQSPHMQMIILVYEMQLYAFLGAWGAMWRRSVAVNLGCGEGVDVGNVELRLSPLTQSSWYSIYKSLLQRMPQQQAYLEVA